MSVSASLARVAVFFARLGPYHFARLRAAGREMQVTAVEFSNVDPVYAWDEVIVQGNFARVMLFRDKSVDEQPRNAIRTRVRSVLSELRPEVVAIPGWADPCSLAALAWCIEAGIPAVVMSETTPWDHERKWWKEAVKRQLIQCFAAGFAGGTSHAQYLSTLGMNAERITLGYDAVDNAHFSDRAEAVCGEAASLERSSLRAKHGLPLNYFLASARFIEKKNLRRLLAAFARYRQLASQTPVCPSESLSADASVTKAAPPSVWDLVLLGDGPLRPELESQISDLGLHGSVHLPGFKQYPDLPLYYGLARVFIHASTTEEWGLVVNEAMASGLPVLVSRRCGCAADLVQEGRNGFTFDPGDVDQLAQLMQRMAKTQPQHLSDMGAASRDIIAHWGPERFAEGLRLAVEAGLAAPRPRFGMGSRLLLFALQQR